MTKAKAFVHPNGEVAENIASGSRIVDGGLCIYVAGLLWDMSGSDVRKGDRVTIPAQPLRNCIEVRLLDASGVSHCYIARPLVDVTPNRTALTLDQARLIAAQLMVGHAEAAQRLRSLHDLLSSLRDSLCRPASASPAPASAGSQAPGPTDAAPAPARPIGSPAHSFGPIQLDQTGPQGRRRAACLNWA